MVVSTGIVISFGSGFVAEIVDMTGPGQTRNLIDVSHHGTTGARAYKAGKLNDTGELRITMAFNPATTPPFSSTSTACTITWPDSGAAVWAFNAFLTSYEPRGPMEDRLLADVTLKVDGNITITP